MQHPQKVACMSRGLFHLTNSLMPNRYVLLAPARDTTIHAIITYHVTSVEGF